MATVKSSPGAQKELREGLIVAEPIVRCGALFKEKRASIGWTLKYAAARIGISPDHLLAIERGAPIPKSQYTRILRIYNRTIYKLTQGMARQTKPGRFQ